MKADTYAKTVLTVIAICLIWICVRDFAVPVTAQRQNLGEQRVIIVGIDVGSKTLPVSLDKINIEDPTQPPKFSIKLEGGAQWEHPRGNTIPVTLAKVALEPFLHPGELRGITPGNNPRQSELPISIKSIDVEDTTPGSPFVGLSPKRTKSLPVYSPDPTPAKNRR